MAWSTDKDAALAAATAAGTAAANMCNLARTAMLTAQQGAGTAPDSRDFRVWQKRVGPAFLVALRAGGVTPAMLDEFIGPLRERGR